MSGLVSKLKENGIPTGSAVSAIQYLNGRPEMLQEQYEAILTDFAETKVTCADKHEARYTFLYFVQNTIQSSFNTDIPNIPEILEQSKSTAIEYIKNNSFLFVVADEENACDSTGNPKRKKGAKQEGAARIYKENVDGGKKVIIELFMSELDMTKSGATTYFYNCKKKFGE